MYNYLFFILIIVVLEERLLRCKKIFYNLTNTAYRKVALTLIPVNPICKLYKLSIKNFLFPCTPKQNLLLFRLEGTSPDFGHSSPLVK